MRKYHLMGTCHIDLTWHGDETQYADYMEQFTVILVDMMEQYPDMTYTIEQAYHYRKLQQRRPDLIEKLKKYIAEGRIEVVGGMVSTADSNMPCAESLVRNQLIGLKWFKEEMGAEVDTAWLVDAFGSHAQIPQVFESFGMKQLMATRFGGDKHHEVFFAEGLDGTRMLVAGRDCFSLNLPTVEHTRIVFDFSCEWSGAEAIFERVRKIQTDGPIMVDFYVEDEIYPTRRMMTRFHELQEKAAAEGNEAVFSLPRDFFDDMRAYQQQYPIENADFNPEFTGTYSNRVEIRRANRRAETALIDAEKWLALSGKSANFDNAWWEMNYVQFHDVFTGSVPDCTYRAIMGRLADATAEADAALTGLFGNVPRPNDRVLRVVNSLPFPRSEWVNIARDSACTVTGKQGVVPSYYADGKLCFLADVDACAAAIYTLEPNSTPACEAKSAGSITLENEFVTLTVDALNGVSLLEKKSGRTLLKCAKDLLILQGDSGNMQIEQIESTQQHAWARPVVVTQPDDASVIASGIFCDAQGNKDVDWSLTFTVRPGEPMVGMLVHTNWQAEGKRMRVKLNTSLARAYEGIFEIPFGVVRRRPYVPGFCQKGEWPAQRFTAIEDGDVGLALINDGVPGVETLGGTLYTTILRAPTQAYSGMVPDCSSSQHGEHDFQFALLPYTGTWENSDLLADGQRVNNPLRVYAAQDGAQTIDSRLCIDRKSIVLSCVKPVAEKAIVFRVTESIGQAETCSVTLPGAVHAYASNMLEEKLDELPVVNGVITLEFKPWQIRTVYVEMEK